jgi:hypothetical protein
MRPKFLGGLASAISRLRGGSSSKEPETNPGVTDSSARSSSPAIEELIDKELSDAVPEGWVVVPGGLAGGTCWQVFPPNSEHSFDVKWIAEKAPGVEGFLLVIHDYSSVGAGVGPLLYPGHVIYRGGDVSHPYGLELRALLMEALRGRRPNIFTHT